MRGNPKSSMPDNGRKGSRFYAVDARERAVFGPGAATRAAALAAVPATARDVQAKALEVEPGTVVLRAELEPGATTAGRRYASILRTGALELPLELVATTTG